MRFPIPCRTLLATVVLLGAVSSASAQTDYRTKATGMLTVGAGFAGGASMAIQPMDGMKYKPSFAWRGTIDATYPLNPTVAAMLSIGLDSRGFRAHPNNMEEAWQDFNVSYFSIYPAFRFSAFTIGLNIGFPTGASIDFANGTSVEFEELSNQELQVMVEPRLGVVIPVVDEDIGWMGITLGGGITLAPPYELPDNADNDDKMVSGHFGFTWQFGIKGTGQR